MKIHTLPLFGKTIQIHLHQPSSRTTSQIIKQSYKKALTLQKTFNLYDDKSTLNILNKNRELKNPPRELLYLIRHAIKLSKITKGKYDITLGNQILQRKNGQPPSKQQGSYKDIKITKNKIKLKDSSIKLDLGSIAKGYITDRISNYLKQKGITEFIIDSRGDIIVFGQNSYLIEIKHPRKNESFLTLKLQNKAVATSGDYNQYFKTYRQSHILNQTNLASITVISDTLEKADSLATALFTLEVAQREKIIKKNKRTPVLTVDEDLKLKMYNNFENFIYDDII